MFCLLNMFPSLLKWKLKIFFLANKIILSRKDIKSTKTFYQHLCLYYRSFGRSFLLKRFLIKLWIFKWYNDFCLFLSKKHKTIKYFAIFIWHKTATRSSTENKERFNNFRQFFRALCKGQKIKVNTNDLDYLS